MREDSPSNSNLVHGWPSSVFLNLRAIQPWHTISDLNPNTTRVFLQRAQGSRTISRNEGLLPRIANEMGMVYTQCSNSNVATCWLFTKLKNVRPVTAVSAKETNCLTTQSFTRSAKTAAKQSRKLVLSPGRLWNLAVAANIIIFHNKCSLEERCRFPPQSRLRLLP